MEAFGRCCQETPLHAKAGTGCGSATRGFRSNFILSFSRRDVCVMNAVVQAVGWVCHAAVVSQIDAVRYFSPTLMEGWQFGVSDKSTCNS